MPAPVSALPTSDYGMIAARFLANAAAPQLRQAQNTSSPALNRESLVASIRASDNPVEQGSLLRMLDTLTGGRTLSEFLVRTFGTPSEPPAPKYDASSLYGAHGPRLSDIEQTNFGDCYLVATLGAMANERPSDIRNAISYDAATQSFNVQLYDASGNPQTYNVTQAEIENNISEGGGSRRDNGVANAAIWPDVMEVAYAKQLDTNHADGLEQGYTDLANGGWPKDAMEAITGSEGKAVSFNQGARESRDSAMDRMGNSVATALRNDQPVTAWSVQESSGADGLRDDHVYTVTRAFKDKNGDWQVTMRNPWGHNVFDDGAGETNNRNSAFITVPLETLVSTGGLNSFRIGD